MKTVGRKTKVMVFGTFDGVHPGHLNFFKQARALVGNAFLIVSIARDQNVEKIKGGLPRRSEAFRMKTIRNVGGVDRVVLGGARNHLPHIIKERPDIIALGHDQTAYVKGLRQELAAVGLKTNIVRLKAFKRHKYRSSLLKK